MTASRGVCEFAHVQLEICQKVHILQTQVDVQIGSSILKAMGQVHAIDLVRDVACELESFTRMQWSLERGADKGARGAALDPVS